MLASLENMSKEDLEQQKTKLIDMVSYYDSALSDIRHFLDLYNLSASQNSKIFKRQKEISRKRSKAKLALRYTDALLNSLQGFCDFSKMKTNLLDADAIYKPRTDIFEELLNIVGK